MVKPGQILVSTALMDDAYFSKKVVLITQVNADGVVGYMLNQPFLRTLDELVEFREYKNIPLCEGGPVDHQHLYFVHRAPELIGDSMPLTGNLCDGGDFYKAIALLRDGRINMQKIKIFIGYCGWDLGQLDQEIADLYWEVIDANEDYIFSQVADIWHLFNTETLN